MVQKIKQTLLLLLVGLSFLFEVESGLYVVYPFGVGHLNPSKPKFSSRKLDSDSNDRNSFNKTHLHLIYPVNEQLVIMTPEPMEEIKEMVLESTTEIPKPFENEADKFMPEFLTTTDIADEATEAPELDVLRMDLDTNVAVTEDFDSTTAASENSTSSDMDSTTDSITTEISIPETTSTGSDLNSLSIYDSTGPMKLLRKRMFEFNKYVPSAHIKLPKKNSNIMPPSTTPRMRYRKRYNPMTTAVPEAKKETLSSPKQVPDGTMDKTSDKTKERKRYTYKKWPIKTKKNEEGPSTASSVSKDTSENGQRRRKGQEENRDNR